MQEMQKEMKEMQKELQKECCKTYSARNNPQKNERSLRSRHLSHPFFIRIPASIFHSCLADQPNYLIPFSFLLSLTSQMNISETAEVISRASLFIFDGNLF